MKLICIILLFPIFATSQTMEYEPSTEYPYGRLNPEAPIEVSDFEQLIGKCDCLSTARNADQTWAAPQKMTWTFKYIMNGMAVQDETLKEDGSHSGSIRQYIADSSKWYVHYYANKGQTTVLPVWEGEKAGENIVLYKEHKAPNGIDGFYRLTFSEISDDGFNWIGEWVSLDETIVFPTWKIECFRKKEFLVRALILNNVKAFSQAYMSSDFESLSELYSEDAKLFPMNSDIITGREAIKTKWTLPENIKIINHKVTPSEINIQGNYAYDYGYYEGISQIEGKNEESFKGKYVIVWKKSKDNWKIYLDIWNEL